MPKCLQTSLVHNRKGFVSLLMVFFTFVNTLSMSPLSKSWGITISNSLMEYAVNKIEQESNIRSSDRYSSCSFILIIINITFVFRLFHNNEMSFVQDRPFTDDCHYWLPTELMIPVCPLAPFCALTELSKIMEREKKITVNSL